MTDLLELDLVNAGIGLLRADAGPPQLAVYPDAEGNVPEAINVDQGYIRWYGVTEWPKDAEGNAIDGLSVSATTRWYLHCISSTEYGCAALAMRARIAMLNQRPTVTGRACGLIYMEAAEPTNRSELGSAPLYDRPVVYAMLSAPG